MIPKFNEHNSAVPATIFWGLFFWIGNLVSLWLLSKINPDRYDNEYMMVLEFLFAIFVAPLCTLFTLLMFLLKVNREALVNMLEATILGMIAYYVSSLCVVDGAIKSYLNESLIIIIPLICVIAIELVQSIILRCIKSQKKFFNSSRHKF